ncbi:hypothetical protein FOL47_009989, partial [Perkinsus chesapeaki]
MLFVALVVALLSNLESSHSEESLNTHEKDAPLSPSTVQSSELNYRWYKGGDWMRGKTLLKNCNNHEVYCYVAVNESQTNEVAGVVEIDLKYQDLPYDVEKVIRNKMHPPDGILGYLAFVYVAPEYRGQKVAQRLINDSFELVSVAIQHFGAMSLMVDKNNVAAIALYKKVGFVWIR